MDLKQTVIKLLDELLQPVRKHFEENAEAKKLLETVKSYQVTR
jgi:tyrosyl-tRNA synthetase